MKTSLILCILVNVWTLGSMQGKYEVRTVDQCYGKPIPVVCDEDHMVRVVHAYYRQSEDCTSGFHSNYCSREEPGNPACVGNTTCIFTTPWVYLSPNCGYSNNFLVIYQCIPVALQNNICSTQNLSDPSGFLVSPNYPLQYPTSQSCVTIVTVASGYRLRFYLLDVYLTYYNYNIAKQCIDKLYLVDADTKKRTGYLCSGRQRGLVFTSDSNQVHVHFGSEDHAFINAKGFWMFYQSFDPGEVKFSNNGNITNITNSDSYTTTVDLQRISSNDPTINISQSSLTSTTQTETTTETNTITESSQIQHPPKLNPLRDKKFVDMIFLQDHTPWYLKYASNFHKKTSITPKQTPHENLPKDTSKTSITTTPTSTSTTPQYKTPQSFLYYYTTNDLPIPKSLLTSPMHVTPSTTTTPISRKVTRLPPTPDLSLTNYWPKVPMLIDADHPSFISDILVAKHPPRISTEASTVSQTTLKPKLMEVNVAPHSLQANLKSSSHQGLLLGLSVPEIGAIVGGVACFIGLTIAIIVTIAMHKKQRHKQIGHAKKAMTKKPFTEVILAYEPNSTPPTNGISNASFNSPKEDPDTDDEYPSSRDGKVNGTWKSWAHGLVPIDETLEDLYTEVKKCDLDPERARNKAKFIKGRSRSKSLDDLLVRSHQGQNMRAVRDHRSPELNPMTSLSFDSLDCSMQSHSNLTNVTGSLYHSDMDSDVEPEFYERLDDMYSDVTLAHVRVRAKQFEELQQQLETLSLPVTPMSASPYIRMHRSPELMHQLHGSPIDTPFEMSLLGNDDQDTIDIAL